MKKVSGSQERFLRPGSQSLTQDLVTTLVQASFSIASPSSVLWCSILVARIIACSFLKLPFWNAILIPYYPYFLGIFLSSFKPHPGKRGKFQGYWSLVRRDQLCPWCDYLSLFFDSLFIFIQFQACPPQSSDCSGGGSVILRV